AGSASGLTAKCSREPHVLRGNGGTAPAFRAKQSRQRPMRRNTARAIRAYREACDPAVVLATLLFALQGCVADTLMRGRKARRIFDDSRSNRHQRRGDTRVRTDTCA